MSESASESNERNLSASKRDEADQDASDERSGSIRILEAMLHGLIRARMVEFNADLNLKLPNLAAIAREPAGIFFTVPGMAGGFRIKLVSRTKAPPIIFAESGSRIWARDCRHSIDGLNIQTKPFDYLDEPLFDEWVEQELQRWNDEHDRA